MNSVVMKELMSSLSWWEKFEAMSSVPLGGCDVDQKGLGYKSQAAVFTDH